MNYDWGPADRGKPALSWIINEPSFFIEDGWGRVPATLVTEFVFSATLTGTDADEFDGQIFLSIDSEPLSFRFSDGILIASFSNLVFGPHDLYLLAVSATGEAGYSKEFDVLAEPPSMQVGIGLDDGFLHVSLERPMPSSQLSDLSKWKINGFNSEKSDVKVQTGNDSVVIELVNSIGRIEDIDISPNVPSPEVSFDSSLGEMQAKLNDTDRDGDRAPQVVGCQKGGVYPIGTCNPAADWTINRQHLESVGREPREVLNSEKSMLFPGDCWFGGDDPPWRNCSSWTIVAYNWFLEGHLNPAAPANWNAQYDTVVYSSTSGYEGVGYRNGHWEHYDRSKGFFPSSLCAGLNTQWEVRVDCSNCDENDPNGYESKGWNMDAELEADSTCPEFTEIQAMPSVELNDYVQNQLIPELCSMGIAYTASGVTGAGNMFDYYWSRCGSYMAQWNAENPGGLVFVVQARDVESPQGKWIHNMLSIDFENELSERYFLEDEQLQFFYVDMDEPYDQELSGENWPHRSTCNEPLQTDAQKQGEYCCWIIKAGCGFLNWNNCRFRIKDDCNNWTRSENLVPGEGLSVVITAPPDESEYEANEPVEFTAVVIGNVYANDLAEYIKWSVQPAGKEVWYGLSPLAQWPPEDPGHSIISSSENWVGPDFHIEAFNDCELKVKASLDICGEPLENVVTIRMEGFRYVQSEMVKDVAIIVENEHHIKSPSNIEYSKYLITEQTQNGGAPVISRDDFLIDYVVRLESPSDVCLEKYIDTTVSSPTAPDSEKTGQPITVRLYMIKKPSTRHTNLVNLYAEFGIQCVENTFFFNRGESLDINKEHNSAPHLRIHDYAGTGSIGSKSAEKQPMLYISDNEVDTKDYSIILGWDNWGDWGGQISKMYYSADSADYKIRRGTLGGYSYEDPDHPNEYLPEDPSTFYDLNGEQDKLPCYFSDVLKGGFEAISIQAEGKVVKAGIQSRSDVIFLCSHGQWGDENCQHVDGACAIGPFYQGEIASEACSPDYYTPSQFNNVGFSIESEWLVCTACGLMNDAVWQLWQAELIGENSEPFRSICGFTGETYHGISMGEFFAAFSEELSNGSPPDSASLWKFSNVITNDQAVKAWMQSACRLLRNGSGAEFLIAEAASCDESYRYIIESEDEWPIIYLFTVSEVRYEITVTTN